MPQLDVMGACIRRAGETLYARFGKEAGDLINEAIDEFGRRWTPWTENRRNDKMPRRITRYSQLTSRDRPLVDLAAARQSASARLRLGLARGSPNAGAAPTVASARHVWRTASSPQPAMSTTSFHSTSAPTGDWNCTTRRSSAGCNHRRKTEVDNRRYGSSTAAALTAEQHAARRAAQQLKLSPRDDRGGSLFWCGSRLGNAADPALVRPRIWREGE